MSVSRPSLPQVVSSAATFRADALDDYAERILHAAETQLFEHGLRRTSLDRIAKSAGVSRVTLFRRFANRNALLGAVVARQLGRFITEFDSRIAPIREPESRLTTGVVAAAQLLNSDTLLRRLLATDPDEVLPLLTTEAEGLLMLARSYVAAQLERAASEGMPVNGDPEMLAEVLVRLAHSLMLNSATTLTLDEDRLVAFVDTTIKPMVFGTR